MVRSEVNRNGGALKVTMTASVAQLRAVTQVLTPLYVKTLVQAAWMISWRARKSVMTRW